MFSIAICDDNAPDLEQIHQGVNAYLNHHHIFAQVDCFSCDNTFLQAFRQHPYQIVLLDIYLKDASGIDLATKLRNLDGSFELCFITTSTDHALDGYRVKALDYLVKPISRESLWDFLERSFAHLGQSTRSLTVIVDHCPQNVQVQDILFINSINQNTYLHTRHGVLRTWHTLKDLKERLGGPPFYQISRSYLVNFDEVRRMGTDFMLMTDGSEVPFPIHHKYQQAARAMYLEYLIQSRPKP